jgi:DNA polymerase-3 subunit epsilon
LYAIIDIETTGNSFKNGKITEIAIYQHNGFEITGSFSSLIHPEMDIPLFITNLTGLTTKWLNMPQNFMKLQKRLW